MRKSNQNIWQQLGVSALGMLLVLLSLGCFIVLLWVVVVITRVLAG